MLTSTEIDKLKALGGIDWISPLRAKQIQSLVASGCLQISEFDEIDLMEIAAPDFPGERLIVCRNPLPGQRVGSEGQPLRGVADASAHQAAQRMVRAGEHARDYGEQGVAHRAAHRGPRTPP